jgi:hypothetical protein
MAQLVPGSLGPLDGELLKVVEPPEPPGSPTFQFAPPFSKPGLSGPKSVAALTEFSIASKAPASATGENRSQELNRVCIVIGFLSLFNGLAPSARLGDSDRDIRCRLIFSGDYERILPQESRTVYYTFV